MIDAVVVQGSRETTNKAVLVCTMEVSQITSDCGVVLTYQVRICAGRSANT